MKIRVGRLSQEVCLYDQWLSSSMASGLIDSPKDLWEISLLYGMNLQNGMKEENTTQLK